MATNPQIILDLQLALGTRQPLEFVNTYKGVPFTCHGDLISVEEETATFIALGPANLCLENQTETILTSSGIFEPIQAEILSFDVDTGKLVIGNMKYFSDHFGDRTIVRVEPENQIRVRLQAVGQRFTGELLDLSMSGAGVSVSNSPTNQPLSYETHVQVQFELPTGEVELPGVIHNITPRGNCRRLAIRFIEVGEPRAIIYHYILDRRQEIQEEVNQAFIRSRKKES